MIAACFIVFVWINPAGAGEAVCQNLDYDSARYNLQLLDGVEKKGNYIQSKTDRLVFPVGMYVIRSHQENTEIEDAVDSLSDPTLVRVTRGQVGISNIIIAVIDETEIGWSLTTNKNLLGRISDIYKSIIFANNANVDHDVSDDVVKILTEIDRLFMKYPFKLFGQHDINNVTNSSIFLRLFFLKSTWDKQSTNESERRRLLNALVLLALNVPILEEYENSVFSRQSENAKVQTPTNADLTFLRILAASNGVGKWNEGLSRLMNYCKLAR